MEDRELLKELQSRVLEDGLSVSQLNRYANCPFQFFCGYVLRLVPDEEVSWSWMPGIMAIWSTKHCRFWEEHLEGPLPDVEDGQVKIEGLLRRNMTAWAPSLCRLIRKCEVLSALT